jgi:hypothetical protein
MLGILKKPLAALAFQYEECNSRLSFRPSEAAFLAVLGELRSSASDKTIVAPKKLPLVTVFAAASNFSCLSALYSQIPGVEVRPFRLRPADLTVGTMLTLMAVDRTDSGPLYVSQVTRILREMATESAPGTFDYGDFKRRLDAAGLAWQQREFLKQRLELLESFLDLSPPSSLLPSLSASASSDTDKFNARCGSPLAQAFKPGSLTIIDMSCPFVDANTACVMFKIGMEMFLESAGDVGKVIAVDEAHKVCRYYPRILPR